MRYFSLAALDYHVEQYAHTMLKTELFLFLVQKAAFVFYVKSVMIFFNETSKNIHVNELVVDLVHATDKCSRNRFIRLPIFFA